VIGVDIGKNSFHVVGQDRRGAIVLRQKWLPDLPIHQDRPTETLQHIFGDRLPACTCT
jgi:hypothetical protein